jgi:hypothetical protein
MRLSPRIYSISPWLKIDSILYVFFQVPPPMSTPMNLIWLALAQKTAQIIAKNQEALGKVKWTDGEANTESGFSAIACRCCVEAWDSVKGLFPDLAHLSLTADSPDVTITLWNGAEMFAKGKIELKSGKANAIPGSTILSLDINQPVIFCRRYEAKKTGKKTFVIRYGQYHASFGESEYDTFQNRSPRPIVNFLKMMDVDTPVVFTEKEKNDWISHYAACALNRLVPLPDGAVRDTWQEDLVNAIIKEFVKRTSVEEFSRRKSGL